LRDWFSLSVGIKVLRDCKSLCFLYRCPGAAFFFKKKGAAVRDQRNTGLCDVGTTKLINYDLKTCQPSSNQFKTLFIFNKAWQK